MTVSTIADVGMRAYEVQIARKLKEEEDQKKLKEKLAMRAEEAKRKEIEKEIASQDLEG